MICAFVLGCSACGGGGAEPGTGGSDPILLSFSQASQDNVPINRILRFRFSGGLDPASVGPTSIQIREGSAFGLSVPGTYRIQGTEVYFEPQLPGRCDLADTGFKPGTTYRVTVVGYPESYAVRSVSGTALDRTYTYQFATLPEDDPGVFEDQVPAVSPTVTSTIPTNGQAGVTVQADSSSTAAYDGNECRIRFSENIDPCTVDLSTVLVYEYERGDVSLGFVPGPDQTPTDAYTWGGNAVAVTPSPQRVRCNLTLKQTFQDTELLIRPEFTEWPDNALIVIELSFGITDFGNQPLVPYVFAFTTENRAAQGSSYIMHFEGETPILDDLSTADVNSSRAVSRAQGYLLFAGDGDNGANQAVPSLPETQASGCTLVPQANDGLVDDFDPSPGSVNVVLDTGATVNTCQNDTDGSAAVVWEFNTFRVRSGITVRVIGVNPAIILCQGDVLIESGGRVQARGDGLGLSPQGRGGNGSTGTSTAPTVGTGGAGVAGGGSGGSSRNTVSPAYGRDGVAGVGSPNAGVEGGTGGGLGGVAANLSSFAVGGNSGGGGGGGHANIGNAGQSVQNNNSAFVAAARSQGGGVYPSGANADRMLTPSAGSGGGGAGFMDGTVTSSSFVEHTGGAGGAGGGFVDFTSSGDIFVFGTIDAAGARGGNGVASFYSGSAGGGGGSGGGVRLLTPNEINVTGGTITAAGGSGGSGAAPTGGGGGPANGGGAGATGRLVLEDGDSTITGMLTATLVPGEGSQGFRRDVFDAARFQGGGTRPALTTDLVFMGPTSPSYIDPVAADFPYTPSGPAVGPGAGIPADTSVALGATGILIEARGFPIRPDGEADPLSGTGFYTVGYFKDSGSPDNPTWVAAGFPGDVGPRPSDNVGDGITNLNGNAFLQFRITFFLPTGVGPFDPGPFVNRWDVRFSYDQ